MNRFTVRASLAAAAATALLILPSSLILAGSVQDTKKPAAPPVVARCVITDEEIADPATALTTVYNKKTYYFCCGGCQPEFSKNPAKYSQLADLRGEVRAIQPKLDAAKAKLATAEKATPVTKPDALAALRTQVTALEKQSADVKTRIGKIERGETVVAADAPAKPGELYCAVQDSLIPSADKAKTVAYNGKTYYLCCGGCKAKFEADPAKAAKVADERAAKRAASAKP